MVKSVDYEVRENFKSVVASTSGLSDRKSYWWQLGSLCKPGTHLGIYPSPSIYGVKQNIMHLYHTLLFDFFLLNT